LIGVCAAPVTGQTNGSSFTAASASVVDLAGGRTPPASNCPALKSLSGPAFRVTAVSEAAAAGEAPAHCTVEGLVPPTSEFVVQLPAGWNGRLYVHGNGGYAGESIRGPYGRALRLEAMRHGFAAAFANLGHDAETSPGAVWAHDNRQAEIDYSYRALHETTVAAKAIAKAYYGEPPNHAYFEGCSTGGGQGLKAAQRYPEDFDGIAAGAPVFDFVGLQLYGWNNQMAIAKTPLGAEAIERLGRFILDRYDALDGVADGVIEDPRRVDFDPRRDLPRAGDDAEGFTEAEIEALARIYHGPVAGGRGLAPGVPIGAEAAGQRYAPGTLDPLPRISGWATRLVPDEAGYQQQRGNVETWLRYLAFEEDDPDFELESLRLPEDLPRFAFMSEIMDATATDLSAFGDRGGRLLMYHGWGDTGVNPLMSVEYYDAVLDAMGEAAREFFRLYLVPGMFHCRGGVNVDRFDAITPVIEWVEQGRAPEAITAARVEDGRVTRTRPLCPYPEVARHAGAGSTDDAANFSCVRPR
jgi:feruloyl esterase